MNFRILLTIVVVGAGAGLVACQAADSGQGEATARADDAEADVLEITAKDFEFEAPAEVPAGWTKIRLSNVGEQDHFAYIYRLPDSVSFDQYRQDVPTVFSDVYERYASGELTREETMKALGEQLPSYFFNGVVPSGGVALTDPGKTATATVHLEPGTYVMECYVKTPQGTWHTDRGMLKELTVTEEQGTTAPPEADVTLTLSNYEIATEGSFSPGNQTVGVRVTENPEGLMLHDINLIRLNDGLPVDSVVGWMDWMDVDQFRAPAPGQNLGGLEHMTAGRTGYFSADLEPGRYALVSEVYGSRGMVHEFTVGDREANFGR